jgi:hypothetical protein
MDSSGSQEKTFEINFAFENGIIKRHSSSRIDDFCSAFLLSKELFFYGIDLIAIILLTTTKQNTRHKT